MPRNRVLLVDDHAIWRDGIRSILEDTEFRVVGEASSEKKAWLPRARCCHKLF
jgi:DNA-binding NarL/FixJ family response regulator